VAGALLLGAVITLALGDPSRAPSTSKETA
jgi:hypothetical protein